MQAEVRLGRSVRQLRKARPRGTTVRMDVIDDKENGIAVPTVHLSLLQDRSAQSGGEATKHGLRPFSA